MPKIRITETSPIAIEFTEGDFEENSSRRCATIGHPGASIDWRATAERCRAIEDGLEIELVPQK